MPQLDLPIHELRQYLGSSPLPDDFDDYWGRALEELNRSGIDYTFEPAEFSAPGVRCEYLYFTGVGNARVCCKFLCPAKIEGRIPGIAMFHGYSGSSGSWMPMLPYAYGGSAVLAMDVRGQMGRSEDTLCATGNTLRGHIIRGLAGNDPEKLFFRNVFLDAAMTARILMGFDFVDGARIGATGGSQGGALTVACAALEPGVKMIAALYPFLSDYKRTWELDLYKHAYEELSYYVREMDPRHQNIDRMFELLGYIDVSHLASRIRGETYMFLTLQDEVCPPSTQFAVYNRIRAAKSCEIYPNHGHETLPRSDDLIYEYFKRL